MRASLARRSGAMVALGPLPETDVAALVTAMLGTPPEDALRQLTAQAAGNPLYLRELVDALARERAQPNPALRVPPAQEHKEHHEHQVHREHQEQLPASLAALLSDRLGSVSAQTAQILRTAALLGGQPISWVSLAVELQRDWARQDTVAAVIEIVLTDRLLKEQERP